MSLSVRTGTLLLVVLTLVACARSPEAKKARYLDRGDRYFQKEQFREAVLEYRNALRIDGNNAQGNRQLGLTYYQLGQFVQAVRFLTKAQELDPDNTEVRLKLAKIGRASCRERV